MIRSSQLTPQMRSWFLNPGSMTKRLEQVCQQTLEVNLLQQKWQYPLRSETQKLDLPHQQKAILREVELLCKGEIWIYARTIIAAQALTGPLRRIHHLGTRPLGKMLFRFPNLHRSPFEIVLLAPSHPEYSLALRNVNLKKPPSHLFARIYIFSLEHRSLLLTEVFLPAAIKGLQ